MIHQPLLQELGLTNRPWEPVEQGPAGAVRLDEARGNDVAYDRVWDQLALVHVALGEFAEICAFLQVLAKDVARGNVRNGQCITDSSRLGALSCTRWSKENDIHGMLLSEYPACRDGRQSSLDLVQRRHRSGASSGVLQSVRRCPA